MVDKQGSANSDFLVSHELERFGAVEYSQKTSF